MMKITELLLTFTELELDLNRFYLDLKIWHKIQGILQDSRRFNKDSQIPKIQPRFKDLSKFQEI